MTRRPESWPPRSFPVAGWRSPSTVARTTSSPGVRGAPRLDPRPGPRGGRARGSPTSTTRARSGWRRRSRHLAARLSRCLASGCIPRRAGGDDVWAHIHGRRGTHRATGEPDPRSRGVPNHAPSRALDACRAALSARLRVALASSRALLPGLNVGLFPRQRRRVVGRCPSTGSRLRGSRSTRSTETYTDEFNEFAVGFGLADGAALEAFVRGPQWEGIASAMGTPGAA